MGMMTQGLVGVFAFKGLLFTVYTLQHIKQLLYNNKIFAINHCSPIDPISAAFDRKICYDDHIT